MEEKKSTKLKWVNPALKNLNRSKMTGGADCYHGSLPGGGRVDNCRPGSLAFTCWTGVGPVWYA